MNKVIAIATIVASAMPSVALAYPASLFAGDPSEPYSAFYHTSGVLLEYERECREELDIDTDTIPVGAPLFNFRRCVSQKKRQSDLDRRIEQSSTRRGAITERKSESVSNILQQHSEFMKRSLQQQENIRESYRKNSARGADFRDIVRSIRARQRRSVEVKEDAARKELQSRSEILRRARQLCRNNNTADRIQCINETMHNMIGE